MEVQKRLKTPYTKKYHHNVLTDPSLNITMFNDVISGEVAKKEPNIYKAPGIKIFSLNIPGIQVI
jgi:hypothetical protein